MKHRLNKLLSFFLSFVLCTSLVPTAAFAATPQTITDNYSFVLNTANEEELTDSFTFREDCFTRSSYLGCAHLYELSAQAALASAHYMKDGDHSQGAKNIIAMLGSMGFSNVETNAYYGMKPIDSSIGVAVGERTIVEDGTSYTLLAIIPRSAGYGIEWASNVKLDGGNIHAGFKAGRDEVLRFVRQYVEKNGVSGKLKLWIAGHSRGAAVSNLLGGFFADGGVEYLGSDLSLSTKDIYCYCMATPNAIKDGASMAEELSVAGNRESYPNDTAGEQYTSAKEGTVSVSAARFNGIRTFVSDADVVPLVPLSGWGYTRYGTTMATDADGAATLDEMIAQYKKLGDEQQAYNRLYTDQGDPRNFTWSTFNFWNLDPSNPSLDNLIVDAPETLSDGTIVQSLNKHLAGMKAAIPDTDFYVSDYQDLYISVAGIVPYVMSQAESGNLSNLVDDAAGNNLIRGLLASYLAYASQRLEKGDTEAAATVLLDLAAFLSGEDLSGIDAASMSRDDFLRTLIRGLVKNENSTLMNGIASALYSNEVAKNLLWAACKGWLPKAEQTDAPRDEAHLKSALVAFLAACDTDSTAFGILKIVLLGVGVLGNFPFASTVMALGNTSKENLTDIAQVLVDDLLTKPALLSVQSDSGNDEEQYEAVMDALNAYVQAEIDKEDADTQKASMIALKAAADNYFETVVPNDTDANQQYHRQTLIAMSEHLEANGVTSGLASNSVTSEKYESLDAAADDLLAKGIVSIQTKVEDKDANKYFGILKDNTTQLRTLATSILFTGDGTQAYSTEYNLSVIATLMRNYHILIGAHSNAGYMSWARAVNLNGGLGGDHTVPSPGGGGSGFSMAAQVAMHRLYNPNGGEHFYTASTGERDLLVKAGWTYEGIGWYAPSSSSIPVHRLYNANGGDHHYTLSSGERDLLVKAGWTYEGVCWYSDANQSIRIYRQYNPNAKTGAHNFTKSSGERNLLVKVGWNDEGIAWYAVA